MKKIQIFLLPILFLAFLSPVQAQGIRISPKHYLGFWIDGGMWNLMPTGSDVLKNTVGAGATIGFAYDLQYKHLIFQTGLGAEYGMATFRTQPTIQASVGAIDMDNDYFDYTYEFGQRNDQYMDVAGVIPALLGGQWKRFYFLAGAKLKYHIYTRNSIDAKLNTYGLYPQFDPFRNMPEYEFVEGYGVTRHYNTNFNIDVALSGEIGIRLGTVSSETGYDKPDTRTHYRLAFFADYGMLDIHKADTKKMIVTPDTYLDGRMLNRVEMNDILATDGIASKVNNLMVGIKFTCLFQLPEKKNCLMCKFNRPLNTKGGTKLHTDF